MQSGPLKVNGRFVSKKIEARKQREEGSDYFYKTTIGLQWTKRRYIYNHCCENLIFHFTHFDS
jgi:hypothetical protein